MLKKTLEDTWVKQFFQYDMLLLVNGDKRSLKKILKILATYEAWSWQAINKEKSATFVSN